MSEKLMRLREDLGGLGLAALLVLAGVAVFHFLVLGPMQARNGALQERAARQAPSGDAAQPASTAEQLSAIYEHLKQDGETTDWLAKLHAISAATGVHMQSASYRSQRAEGRILRYEIVLPVAGGYPQIREFLRRALAEIPVMSIDQLTLKRQSRSDGAVQAELRLTLHLVKS